MEGFIANRLNDTKDNWGSMNAIGERRGNPTRWSKPPGEHGFSGMVPTEQLAESWLAFIRLSEHPIMSLP